MGVAKDGSHKPGYTQGIDIKAPLTVLAEGCRGHLTKQLIRRYQLDAECDPQTYGIGIKELWQLPAGRAEAGKVVHTIGWPLDPATYGGSFIYHLDKDRVAIGFVAGLDYDDPMFSPFEAFQQLQESRDREAAARRRIDPVGRRARDRRGRLPVAAEVRDAGRDADRRYGRPRQRAEDQGHASGDPLGDARGRTHRRDRQGRRLGREAARIAGDGGTEEGAQHPARVSTRGSGSDSPTRAGKRSRSAFRRGR